MLLRVLDEKRINIINSSNSITSQSPRPIGKNTNNPFYLSTYLFNRNGQDTYEQNKEIDQIIGLKRSVKKRQFNRHNMEPSRRAPQIVPSCRQHGQHGVSQENITNKENMETMQNINQMT